MFNVLIGRMQLPHQGHLNAIKECLSSGRALLLLGVSQVLNERNVFTFEERKEMILAHEKFFEAYKEGKLIIEPAHDVPNDDDLWKKQIKATVNKYAADNEVVLRGALKDESSYYLNLFPEWRFESNSLMVKTLEKEEVHAATIARQLWYDKQYATLAQYCSKEIAEYLRTRTIN